MIDLDRHIEILLLSNDCVIVPGFGGFVAHYVSARYDAADGMWLPPYRTLGFNPQLTMNDSLLVQSYIEAYDISYPDALKRIDAEVVEVRRHLESEGSYSMNDLGQLFVNAEGHIEFRPCEAGILTPELYGLGSVELQSLAAEVVEPVAQSVKLHHGSTKEVVHTAGETSSQAAATIVEPQETEHARRVSMTFWRNIAAACIAVMAFLLIPSPLENGSTVKQGLVSTEVLREVMPHSEGSVMLTKPLKGGMEKPREEKYVKQDAETHLAEKDVSTPTTKSMETKPYCLVLASHVRKSNAEAYVADLHRRGYAEARVLGSRHCKVVYGAYASEQEVLEAQRRLRRQTEFANCWSMKMPEIN